MKTSDVVRRAGRNLKRAKMRTFLTSVAIAVGGFAIMVSLMAGEGARQYVDRVISANMDPDSLMIAKDEKMFGGGSGMVPDLEEYSPDSMNQFGMEIKALNSKDMETLSARSDIKEVQPVYQLQPKYVEFSTNTGKRYTSRVEVRDSTLAVATSAGKELFSGTKLADDEAVIPETYLSKLGVKSPKEMIGQKVIVTLEQAGLVSGVVDPALAAAPAQPKEMKREFRVVSVAKKTADQMTSPSFIYVSGDAAKAMNDFATEGTSMYQKYMGAMALVDGDREPETVKNSLEKEGYTVFTAKDLQSMIFTFVNLLQGVVMGFGILALIVSIFGIVNTMYISVLERTQQIGLMKALGASGKDIGRLFRYEAAWVGFLGGAIGVLVAWIGSIVANPMISQALGLGEHHLLIFQIPMAVGVILVLMFVAVVAGWLPSKRAARLDPIEALRTE